MPWGLIGNLIWLLILGGGFLLVLFLLLLLGAAGASMPEVGMSRVFLNCPHCGAETPASEPVCRQCRRSFREESLLPRPVIDAPKLRSAVGDRTESDKHSAPSEAARFS
jgi:hypothetical protein